MGKIIASYLVKVHLHEDDEPSENPAENVTPTNDQVKSAVIDGVQQAFQIEATVSLIERTDD